MGTIWAETMAGSERLSAIAVQQAKTKGVYSDGRGLYLRVSNPNARSWIFRYMRDRKAHEAGLGRYPEISLAEARKRAMAARQLLAHGKDPLEEKASAKAELAREAAKAVTFKEAAERYVDAHRAAWKNAKHSAQWGATLATYAFPIIGNTPVQLVDTALVLSTLEPIWSSKTETASRLRGRIESILDWARVRGHRDGDNPARWRGHLDKMLPAPSKVQKVRHHAALPYAELPEFMAALRKQDGVAARALEFAILTAARTGEVLGASWSEIDLDQAIWTVPADRMKAGREHRVPLSARALQIVSSLKNNGSNFVFAGSGARPLSNMALLMLLRRMKRDDLTAHGFRSTFRDWCAEQTSFPSEVAEMALAHSVGDKVEAAYRRGDLFAKRRDLMDGWGAAAD